MFLVPERNRGNRLRDASKKEVAENKKLLGALFQSFLGSCRYPSGDTGIQDRPCSASHLTSPLALPALPPTDMDAQEP